MIKNMTSPRKTEKKLQVPEINLLLTKSFISKSQGHSLSSIIILGKSLFTFPTRRSSDLKHGPSVPTRPGSSHCPSKALTGFSSQWPQIGRASCRQGGLRSKNDNLVKKKKIPRKNKKKNDKSQKN